MRAAVLLLALAGCAAYEPPARVETIKVPVPVPCLTEAEVPPPVEVLTRAQIVALGEYAGTLRLWTERIRLIDQNAEIRAVLQACAKKGPGG